MSESGFGDFEFERKFFLRELPAVAEYDPTPALIVQAYLFAADGYAVRIRLQGPAPDTLDGSSAELVALLGEDSIGTMTAKGPAAGGTRKRLQSSCQLRSPSPCLRQASLKRWRSNSA